MIHAAWPRSRTRMMSRILRLSDALRTVVEERDRLREELRLTQEARAGDHEEILRLHGLVAELGRLAADPTDCRFQLHSRDEHRLLHEQADIIARQQREIGQLEAAIVRMRPRLMRKEKEEES